MNLPLTRHFAHYAAIRALDPLRKYLKCNNNLSQTFNERPVRSEVETRGRASYQRIGQREGWPVTRGSTRLKIRARA